MHKADEDYPVFEPKPSMREWVELKRAKLNRKKSSVSKSGFQQLPEDPYQHWMKPSGNVVALTIYSTRNTKQAIDIARYQGYVTNQAIRNNWIPWIYVDAKLLTPHLTMSIKNEDEWIAWREKEQKERRALHSEESEKYNKAWAAQDEVAALKSQEAMSKALDKFATTLAETMAKATTKAGK